MLLVVVWWRTVHMILGIVYWPPPKNEDQKGNNLGAEDIIYKHKLKYNTQDSYYIVSIK